jgi:hypothetical protein
MNSRLSGPDSEFQYTLIDARDPSFLKVAEHDYDGDSDHAGIVGMWKIQFVAANNATIPDGTVVDQGYAVWHSDGTEIMNSGRAPMTGSFCLGVWKETGRSTYKLNHFTLSWDPTGTSLIGPGQIQEQVTLNQQRDRYTGTFTLTQFDPQGNTLALVTGDVTGTRITVDTPISN